MHPRAVELIRQLQLVAHPEGGYYRRMFTSTQLLADGRAASSAILFLLPAGAVSRWHRVDADELWHFHEGEPLQLLCGPERIESGWWDAGLVERDYFIAQAADGALVWVYRTRLPPAERTLALARHVRRYYYPYLSEQQIMAIFGRDGDAFWQAYASGKADDESLHGWLLNLMTKAEVEKSPYFEATTREQAARLVKEGDIQATLSWLTAMDRAARERGVPLVLFIVPPGTVDPDYVDYWKPWPRFYAFNVIADYRQDRLLEALSRTSIRYVDLRKDFEGVRGAYRRSDAHWTDKGVEIAANRVFQELRRLERR